MSILNTGRTSLSAPSGPKVVRFQLNYNLKSLLLDCANEKDTKLYEELIYKIRNVGQEIRDDDLTQLLKEARGCITILDGNFRIFVQVVLILRWTHRSEEVVNEYQGFLQDLCAAHNFYTKLVIEHLISYFKTDAEVWENGVPNEKSKNCFTHLHQVILSILTVIPMSKDILLSSVQSCYPYLKRPGHEHEAYVYNVLLMTEYAPQLKYELLKFLIMKLVSLDVNSPKIELENNQKMEVDGVFEMEENSTPSVGQSLDLTMSIMFNYIYSATHNEEGLNIDKLKVIYSQLVKVFDSVILPTHSTQHVQFLLFYLFGLKPALSISFLRNLWSKVGNPSIPSVLRQTSVFYIASLLARAKYISVKTVQDTLADMTNWIHSYIANQDESGNLSFQDTRAHGVFYATCQALFYVIAFRYKELIQNKGLVFLQGLNLTKIVTCRLNPLKVCLPVIVSNFASVARAYQLAYCYTVIERNSRNTLPQVFRDSTGATTGISSVQLDTFFPFDPYLLPRSRTYITPYFRESCAQEEGDLETVAPSQNNDDDDDFLESNTPKDSSVLASFSYSTSPGFLH